MVALSGQVSSCHQSSNLVDTCPVSKAVSAARRGRRASGTPQGRAHALGRAAQPRTHPGSRPDGADAGERRAVERDREEGGRGPGDVLPQLPQPRGARPGGLPLRSAASVRRGLPVAPDPRPGPGPARVDGPPRPVRHGQGGPGRRHTPGDQRARQPVRRGPRTVDRGRGPPPAGERGSGHHPPGGDPRRLPARHRRTVADRPARRLADAMRGRLMDLVMDGLRAGAPGR